jgi:hypothetical protein
MKYSQSDLSHFEVSKRNLEQMLEDALGVSLLLDKKYICDVVDEKIENLKYLPKEEINKEIDLFESIGFEFFQDWTMDKPYTPERILLPREKFPLSRIEIANKYSKDDLILQVSDYFYYLFHPGNIRSSNLDYSASFLNGEDITQASLKYGNNK